MIGFSNQENFSNKFYWYGYSWRKKQYSNRATTDILEKYLTDSKIHTIYTQKSFNFYTFFAKAIKINFILPTYIIDRLTFFTSLFLINHKLITTCYVVLKKNSYEN